MNSNKRMKILLAIFVSSLFVLSSSVLFTNTSENSPNIVSPFITATYNITFTESGLPTATQWNVTLEISSNVSHYQVSNTTTIVFSEINGSYNYTVNAVAGYNTTSHNGTKIVNGLNVSQSITFTKLASVSISPVTLGTADNYTILSETGITTTGTTSIKGNIGVSPSAASSITGFGLTMSSNGQYSTSPSVSGRVYAANYANPTPSNLTIAVNDMKTAYTSAQGMTNPNYVNLGAGNVNGMTLVPGLYKWGTGLLITTNVTLSGNSSSVWVFQISGGLTFANGAHMILKGGAQPQNIFWQAASGVSIGTYSAFSGIILTYKAITVHTGATLNGRAYSQTAVTLDANTVTAPSTTPVKTYNTTFTETGLPSGTKWFVNVTGLVSSGPITTNTFYLYLANGSYTYSTSTVNKSFSTTYPGKFNIQGSSFNQTIKYVNVSSFEVTFTAIGLPTGTPWYVNITNHNSNVITGTTYKLALTNGTYSYSISSGNHNFNSTNNKIVVAGHSLSVNITFTKSVAKPSSNDDLYIIIAVVVVAAAAIGTAVMFIRRK
jgi:hypothetical protein